MFLRDAHPVYLGHFVPSPSAFVSAHKLRWRALFCGATESETWKQRGKSDGVRKKEVTDVHVLTVYYSMLQFGVFQFIRIQFNSNFNFVTRRTCYNIFSMFQLLWFALSKNIQWIFCAGNWYFTQSADLKELQTELLETRWKDKTKAHNISWVRGKYEKNSTTYYNLKSTESTFLRKVSRKNTQVAFTAHLLHLGVPLCVFYKLKNNTVSFHKAFHLSVWM